jgi:hypothetical protein
MDKLEIQISVFNNLFQFFIKLNFITKFSLFIFLINLLFKYIYNKYYNICLSIFISLLKKI